MRRFPDSTPEDLQNNPTCAICLIDLEQGKTLPCGHTFHRACLRTWFASDGFSLDGNQVSAYLLVPCVSNAHVRDLSLCFHDLMHRLVKAVIEGFFCLLAILSVFVTTHRNGASTRYHRAVHCAADPSTRHPPRLSVTHAMSVAISRPGLPENGLQKPMMQLVPLTLVLLVLVPLTPVLLVLVPLTPVLLVLVLLMNPLRLNPLLLPLLLLPSLRLLSPPLLLLRVMLRHLPLRLCKYQ